MNQSPVVPSQLEVGRHVRIKYKNTSSAFGGVRGLITGVTPEAAVVRSDKSGKDVRVPLDNIAEVEALGSQLSLAHAMRWVAPISLAVNALTLLLVFALFSAPKAGSLNYLESGMSDVQLSITSLERDVAGLQADMGTVRAGVDDLQTGVTIRTQNALFGKPDPLIQRLDSIETQLDAISRSIRSICQGSSSYGFCY